MRIKPSPAGGDGGGVDEAHCTGAQPPSAQERQMTAQAMNTTIYDAAALESVLDAMAAALAGRLQGGGPVTLVGVRRRGAPLADALHARLLARLPGTELARLDLLIRRYADDLTLLHPETELTEQAEHAGIDLSGRTLVVVDDVLYAGHSLNKAVQYLLGKGARAILAAVLVDRVCATLPIHADVAGLKLQVAPGQIIDCHVPPYEPDLRIVLVQPGPAP
jgi:pyrimidine operon attenuation protein/uracil phosphoribosyltransferase